MKDKKIALLGNELIIREDIRIDELQEMYPSVILRNTNVDYYINDGYVIDGIENIILKTTYTAYNAFIEKEETHEDVFSSLGPYLSIRFIGQESPEGVFMRQMDPEGEMYFLKNWHSYEQVYPYQRPLDIDHLDNFPVLQFIKMREEPIKEFMGPPFQVNIKKYRGVIYVPIV